jgi:enoyl-CoA hydratase/carnithine racemase
MQSGYHKELNVTMRNHVGTIELNRPPHNFLDETFLESIVDCLEDFDVEPDCRAVLLCSAGKNFCAGANYDPDLSAAQSSFSLAQFFKQVERFFRCQTPIVAAVQGAAIGGGLGLAVAADFRVTCPEGRFSANFTRLGFNPGFGLPVTLPRLIGYQRASLLFLTSRRIKGEQAAAWGLADLITPLEEVRRRARALAEEIGANAPLAVVATRQALRRSLLDQLLRQSSDDLELQTRLRDTRDWAEGVAAVAERREPNFEGR